MNWFYLIFADFKIELKDCLVGSKLNEDFCVEFLPSSLKVNWYGARTLCKQKFGKEALLLDLQSKEEVKQVDLFKKDLKIWLGNSSTESNLKQIRCPVLNLEDGSTTNQFCLKKFNVACMIPSQKRQIKDIISKMQDLIL